MYDEAPKRSFNLCGVFVTSFKHQNNWPSSQLTIFYVLTHLLFSTYKMIYLAIYGLECDKGKLTAIASL